MGKFHVANLNSENFQLNLKMEEEIKPKSIPDDTSKTDSEETDNAFPAGIESLTNQVAGHMQNGKTCGMLKCDGKVLKPIINPINGQKEIDFYEELNKTKDESLSSLKEFVPKYYGTVNITLNNKEVKCIVLEDVTKDFKEPCIMDIKIGRRTWDPSATREKILSEDKKYQETKRDLGICVPGFLVHKLSNGRLCRYGKEYGKKLNSETIRDALKIYLNADVILSRDLLLQLLVDLWRILHWARKQRHIRLFSSSLLLMYDARRLRHYLPEEGCVLTNKPTFCKRSVHLYKPISLMKLNDECTCTGFSGQFTKDGPILQPAAPTKLPNFAAQTNNCNSDHPWEKRLSKLKRVHSFQNNYDRDLQKLKNNYMYMLDDLVNDYRGESWAAVKLIDFAHTFPSEHSEIDKNYLEGIENLVKLIEEFLTETVN